jgi:hypothetical protein
MTEGKGKSFIQLEHAPPSGGHTDKGKGEIRRRSERRAFSSAGHYVTVPVIVCVTAVVFFFPEQCREKNSVAFGSP